MNVTLAYGKTGLPVQLPDDASVTVLEPRYVRGCPDPESRVREALREPIGCAPLRSLVRSTDRIGVVFSDITRPAPTDLLLPVLLDEVSHVPPTNVILFNATGTHRPNTPSELREMLGDRIFDRYQIIQNDSSDRASHVRVGATSTGNDIWIHRAFVGCDVKILTGFIEPHIFAGFSGGGKAVVPGLAALDTILRNHSVQNIGDPCARWGNTEGNPVRYEIDQAAAMTNPTFLLNVALNRDKEITGVFAGHWRGAHERGCVFVKHSAQVAVDRPFDIVIVSNSGYPLDLNVYQSVKGMSVAAQVVKRGGSIIVAAECCDGIPEHSEYARILSEVDSPEALLRHVRDRGTMRQDSWQAHIQAVISNKADVYFYSDNLTDREIEGALLIPCGSIEGRVATLLGQCGANATICVLPEGPQTIPSVCAQ